jgi:hypothetical protein
MTYKQQMFKVLAGFVSVLLLIFYVSCHRDAKPFEELTPKEKLAYMYQVYNAQHEDYMIQAANPALTDMQKQILRKKKPILVSLQTLIPIYDQQVQLGVLSQTSEQQIYNLLTELQGFVIQLE